MVSVGAVGEILKHPDEIYFLLKLKMVLSRAEKQMTPNEPHWKFCYTMLYKSIRSDIISHPMFPPVDTHFRNAVCVFYLVHRALDTIEDDTSISPEIKVPMLIDFHRRLYDRDYKFSCGKKNDKVLMDQFHHVSTAFMELQKGYQEAIEDITKSIGAGMAKFICKEVETIDDYDEYCHHVAGLFGICLSKLFNASGKQQDPALENLSNSLLMLFQKKDIIEDYLEDINEIPKPRVFWPREIWSQYVNKIEDFKYEENSVKAVECLNEMVTDALKHTGDCLNHITYIYIYMGMQVVGFGTLALCYNNIQVFKAGVKLRPGLVAKIVDRTTTMSDVYNAFFEFASLMKSKVEMHDTNNATMKTLSRLNEIQEICRKSGLLNNRKFYIIKSEQGYNSSLDQLIKLAVIAPAWIPWMP
ncbi:hypothetical protein Dsin_020825 [Dipteronia sinensis]|uniref:Squalene synthase n=1 Tax=Dipteronia sinensis TaxID=43782 RepID=A0AAE0AAR7_9ROSI|nr:hypothetical protein Dsin_020825 [Dipteronia sinensis]